jgi:subtilisin-like proprotein convertase family protein
MYSRLTVCLGLFMAAALAFGQFTISGRVTTAAGAGLGGVNVEAVNQATLTNTRSPGTPILDHSEFTDNMEITGAGNILGVEVDINITHTWRGDLIVRLIHPDATTVVLHNRTGGSADNLIGTYPTTLTPAEPLSLLFGKPAAGTWGLFVRDAAAGDTGTLNSWALRLVVGADTFSGTTAADGAYTIGPVPAGSFTVSATGGTFIPASRVVTVGPDATGVDFELDEGSIQGRITDRATPVAGVTVAFFARLGHTDQTNTPGLPIPDLTTVEDTMTVTLPGNVGGLSVGVDISHTFIGDLVVTVQHPDATQVILHNRTGGAADNIVTMYPDVTAPAQSLGVLSGKPKAGDWKLIVRDAVATDTGTLNSWTLRFVDFAATPLDSTVTGPDGRYLLNGLGTGEGRVVPTLAGFVLSPMERRHTLPPSVTGADFTFPAPTVTGVSAPDTVVAGPHSQNGAVTLSGPVGPTGPLAITAASSNASVVVPASINVPPGQATATFPIQSNAVTETNMALLSFVHAGAGQIMTVINTPPGHAGFYGGEFDFRNGLASEQGTLVVDARTYDDFTVPADTSVKSVMGVFQRRSPAPLPTQARVQIRSGISAGNEGTAVFDQVVPVTAVASGLFVFGSSIDTVVAQLDVPLTAGTYHLSISPVGTGTGRYFIGTTSGARGAGSPTANGNAFFSWSGTPPMVAEPVDSLDVFGPGTWDFQYGVVWTAAPVGPTASGRITFGGVDNPAVQPATATVQFRLPNTTAVVSTQVVPVDSLGDYTATAPGTAVYDVAVFETNYGGWTWLRGIAEDVDFSAGSVSGVNFSLLNGDVNNDNSIDLSDFLILAAAYEVSPVTAPEADLNRDGAVDLSDYLLLAANYDTAGPP